MKVIFTSIVFLGLLLTGCNNAQLKPNYEKPAWVSGHSMGAVGICGTHMKGNAKQEEVAMDRALKKLAKQQGASVNTTSTSVQRASGENYNSAHQSQTDIQANSVVNAHTKETWRDPKNNNYYIWMVMD